MYIKKVRLRTLFVPYLEPSGKKCSQKGSLHVQEPKKVPYITKNGSKGPKKVLKLVLKTNLEPFREPLKVPPVGQPKNPFFLRVYFIVCFIYLPHYSDLINCQLDQLELTCTCSIIQ